MIQTPGWKTIILGGGRGRPRCYVRGYHQKYQIYQIYQLLISAFELGDGAGDFEDAVVGSRAHVHALHGVTIYSCSSFDWLRSRFSMSSRSLRSSASACWASRRLRLVSKSA